MIDKLLNDRSDETLVAYSTFALRVSLGIIILAHTIQFLLGAGTLAVQRPVVATHSQANTSVS